ncbi:MAG: HesA/MoeB/ThiF family protein [Bacteroidia bacterium]|nr:HesA/MoeB/ThiF family protein [Bacteroidia bacterium]
MSISAEQLYKRQITLQEIGKQGQDRLLQSKVVVVGCGGLGCVAAAYLAGSGIGSIHLIDFDEVNASNLHRQVFYKIEDVGKPKARVLASYLKKIAPFSKINHHELAVVKENVFDLIAERDIVLDCTDSLPVKYLLNDACVLKNKTLVYGSLYKFDGYVSTFNLEFQKGQFSSNLRDAFPEISKEAIPNCSEVGTLNSIVGIIGLMQANEVLKIVTQVGNPLIDELLIYNSLENTQYKMKLKRSFSKDMIQKIFDNESYYDLNCEIQEETLLLTSEALKNELSNLTSNKNLKIISVIENKDTIFPFKVDITLPYSQFRFDQIAFSTANNYVIVCNKGITSYDVVKRIKEKNPDLKVLSLKGGLLNY